MEHVLQAIMGYQQHVCKDYLLFLEVSINLWRGLASSK